VRCGAGLGLGALMVGADAELGGSTTLIDGLGWEQHQRVRAAGGVVRRAIATRRPRSRRTSSKLCVHQWNARALAREQRSLACFFSWTYTGRMTQEKFRVEPLISMYGLLSTI
jgi:hypothetical protein